MFNMFTNTSAENMTERDETSILMTPPELASYLGIGRNLAYRLLNEGKIKGFKIGNQWKVSRQAVDLWVARNSGLV